MFKSKIKPFFIKDYLTRKEFCNRVFSHKGAAGYILRNVYLHVESTVLLDQDFKIIKETADEYALWGKHSNMCIYYFPKNERQKESQKRLHYLQIKIDKQLQVINKDEIIKIEKRSVNLLTSKSTYSFGHILDYLQKNIAFEILNKKKNVIYLISDNSFVKDFNLYLRAFNINPNKCIIPNNLGEFLFFKRIVVPFSPTEIDHLDKNAYDIYIKKIKEKILIHQEQYVNNKDIKLYLSRGKNARLGRKVIDEEILLEYLKDKNFIIINGDENLCEIIYLFSKAKFIFGLHGSLFLNTLHSEHSCKIIELNPFKNKRVDWCYKFKIRNYKEREDNYKILNIKSDNMNNVKSQDVIEIMKNHI